MARVVVAAAVLLLLVAGCSEPPAKPASPATSQPTPTKGSGTPIVAPPANAPVAGFSWTPEAPNAGDEVAFHDTSEPGQGQAIASWAWDFGDGATSGERAPTHAFAAGDHQVRLTVTGGNGLHGATTRLVSVRDPALEPLDPPAIEASVDGLTVRFGFTHPAIELQATWAFGDGSTGEGPDPEHAYAGAGTYRVELAVRDPEGRSATAATSVEVANRPIAFLLRSTGAEGGEPSIGLTSSGTAFVATNPAAYRSTDGGRTWGLVSTFASAPTGLDPYLWVDPDTDRVYHDNLYIGCSWLSWSDDEGASWTTNPAACGAPVNDHQKIATGAFRAPLVATVYPNVVYYASNALTHTEVGVSLDGGLTWGTSVLGPPGLCGSGGTNGQPYADAEGYVYIGFYQCDATWVGVSGDNGLAWGTSEVDGGTGQGHFDPDLDGTSDGVTYMAWHGSDFGVYYAFTQNHGTSWSRPQRINPKEMGVTMFPSIQAGGPGRIAVSYIATATDAATPDVVPASAEWHLYTSFVSGAADDAPTITTVQDTPEPIQRGPICTGGLGCDSARNLLEFIDTATGPDGRLWITYTDGCGGCTSASGSTLSRNMVARLETGPSLADGSYLKPL